MWQHPRGPIDWQKIAYELPKDGRLQLDPEVRAINWAKLNPSRDVRFVPMLRFISASN